MPHAFGSEHYIPVLRAKAGEWKALEQLSATARSRLTPIVELPPSAFAPGQKGGQSAPKNPRQVLSDFLARASTLSHTGPVFVDFGLLRGTAAHPAGPWVQLARISSEFRGTTIPVVPLNAPMAAVAAAATVVVVAGRGCGLRVTAIDLARQTVAADINRVLQGLGVAPQQVDLLVDLGTTPSSYSHDALRARIPTLTAWRTFTVVGGVFPRDLTKYASTQQVWFEERAEWTHYEREATASAAGARVPTFGDYTTQHGEYFDSPGFGGSVSLRYTLEDRWLILRGEKANRQKNGGFDQMYGHTALLRQRPDFYGAVFSWGDEMIAQHIPPAKKGNSGTWLAVGICHHMTVVANQAQASRARGHAMPALPHAARAASGATSTSTPRERP